MNNTLLQLETKLRKSGITPNQSKILNSKLYVCKKICRLIELRKTNSEGSLMEATSTLYVIRVSMFKANAVFSIATAIKIVYLKH